MHEISESIYPYLPHEQGTPYGRAHATNTSENGDRPYSDREASLSNHLTKYNTQLEDQLEEVKKRLALSEALLQNNKDDVEMWKLPATRWEKAHREGVELNSKAKEIFEMQMEEKEAELESLKTFLDTHDHADATTVVGQLEGINDLVEQLASGLAFQWGLPKDKVIPELDDTVRRYMTRVLGNHFFQALLVCDIHDAGAPSLLQYALQVVLTGWIVKLFQARSNQSLQALSKRIRQEEIQPVYGRWRCLTQRYLRLIEEPDLALKHTTHFEYDVYFSVRYTMLLFGLPLSTQSFEDMKSELRPLLAEIAAKVAKFAVTTMEAVVSRDYRLYRPSSGTFSPDSMETPFSIPSDADEVIGSIALGITSIGKPGRLVTQPELKIFRRAAVITKSILEEVMSPRLSRGKEHKREARGAQRSVLPLEAKAVEQEHDTTI